MKYSVFNVFKIGIGPSSSHTVGPMKAARHYLLAAFNEIDAAKVARIEVILYGSLALTGIGHETDKAVILGLLGETPEGVDVARIDTMLADIEATKTLALLGTHPVPFDKSTDILFRFKETLPLHANGMRLILLDKAGKVLNANEYYSVGGGLIKQAHQFDEEATAQSVPYPFAKAAELAASCEANNLTIAELMWANQAEMFGKSAAQDQLQAIWDTMQTSVKNGITAREAHLPGGLDLARRAPSLYNALVDNKEADAMDWLSVYAIAVNEENAAAQRIVTAPTNGSAGVIPAVLSYTNRFLPNMDNARCLDFLMVAGAIGLLYQKNASISAAEMGCQGEIGVSSSMAAAGFCFIKGGTTEQILNAAEIAMEHHLGMTCDPVNGLVQIPCIERNTMGAIKAVNAAKLALTRTAQYVSLDKVIQTMFETGKDMSHKYKETSLGGLALHAGQTVC